MLTRIESVEQAVQEQFSGDSLIQGEAGPSEIPPGRILNVPGHNVGLQVCCRAHTIATIRTYQISRSVSAK